MSRWAPRKAVSELCSLIEPLGTRHYCPLEYLASYSGAGVGRERTVSRVQSLRVRPRRPEYETTLNLTTHHDRMRVFPNCSLRERDLLSTIPLLRACGTACQTATERVAGCVAAGREISRRARRGPSG
jgi:hypothetical protein